MQDIKTDEEYLLNYLQYMLFELGDLKQEWQLDGTKMLDFEVEGYSFHFYRNYESVPYILVSIKRDLHMIHLRVYHEDNQLEFSDCNNQNQMQNCQWLREVPEKVLAYLDREKKAKKVQ